MPTPPYTRPIRLLFCADLHIGRSLHGKSLLLDQKHALLAILAIAREQKVSHLIIGGDLFDRSIPAAEAVALADWFFQECITGNGLEVIVIAGNHDSPERLDFAAGLLAHQGLHIVGSFPDQLAPLVLGEGPQALELYALPYAEPATIHHRLDRREGIDDASHDLGNHQLAWERIMAALRRDWEAKPARRRILVAHLLASGGAESDSERPLSIGGAQAVTPTTLAGFDLVLLGHLHRSQECWPGVWYAGSPVCYGASEIDQEKSVLIIDPQNHPSSPGRPRAETKKMPEPGPDLFGESSVALPPAASAAQSPPAALSPLAVTRHPILPLRPVRRLEGSMEELLLQQSDDYVYLYLREAFPVPDAFARLQKNYPWLLMVERLLPASAAGSELDDTERRRLAIARGDLDLVLTFLEDMTGSPAPADWQEIVRHTLEELRQADARPDSLEPMS